MRRSNHGGYRHGKRWTEGDIAYLKEKYTDWTVDIPDIAEHLGRTEASIWGKARHLGLSRPLPTFLYDDKPLNT